MLQTPYPGSVAPLAMFANIIFHSWFGIRCIFSHLAIVANLSTGLHCHVALDCHWQYQLVLSWYLHQPESHQLSLQNVLDFKRRTPGPKDRTPGLPGSDKNKYSKQVNRFCQYQYQQAVQPVCLSITNCNKEHFCKQKYPKTRNIIWILRQIQVSLLKEILVGF